MKKRPLGPFMVAPIGLGAMRLTGPNVFGPPDDRAGAIALLRAAVDGGVDHIDTAQYYGPDISSPTNRRSCVAASKTISGRSESTSSPSSTSG